MASAELHGRRRAADLIALGRSRTWRRTIKPGYLRTLRLRVDGFWLSVRIPLICVRDQAEGIDGARRHVHELVQTARTPL